MRFVVRVVADNLQEMNDVTWQIAGGSTLCEGICMQQFFSIATLNSDLKKTHRRVYQKCKY